MKKNIKKLCLSLFLLHISIVGCFASTKISSIVVTGNKRVESSTVESYLEYKVGDSVDVAEQDLMIKNLYQKDLFKQVNIKMNGTRLHINVEENPLVVKVLLSGNKKKGKGDLEKAITLVKGDSLSAKKMHNDLSKLKDIYKSSGRYVTDVEVKLKYLDDNRVIVTYEIEEGPISSVNNIYFVGNKAFRDYELKSSLMTQENRWFRVMSNTNYQPGALEYDKEILKNFYHSVGYADFRVVSASAELSPGKEHFDVTFVVDEGLVYQIASVKIENDIKEIDNSIFNNLIKISSGDRYNANKVNSVASRITARLADRGFLDAVCSPEYKKNPRNNTVDIVLKISSASTYRLNQINVTGNLKTYDSVIRRAFGIHEGDLYNRSLIARGEHRVRGTNFFENVQVTPTHADGKPGLVDLNVLVEEKSTAEGHLQMNYSTARSVGVEFGYNERNFLGSGKHVGLSLSAFKGGAQSSHISISEPHFLDSDANVGFVLGYSNSSGGHTYQAYNKISRFGKVNLSYDINDDWIHDVDYSLKYADLNFEGLDESKKFNDNKKEVDEFRKKFKDSLKAESEGKFYISSVSNALIYNKMDNRHAPKNGFLTSATQEFAGLGGDIKYLKHEGNMKYAKSFVDNTYTLLLSGSVGHITGLFGEAVRPDDRFNLGDFNFRGFAPSGIGPREKLTNHQQKQAKAYKSRGGIVPPGEALGGKKFYNINAELQFPISKEINVNGSFFFDGGAVWDYDIVKNKDTNKDRLTKSQIEDRGTFHASVGICASIILPMMPIKICYAKPLLYDLDANGNIIDELQSFHFRMSAGF